MVRTSKNGFYNVKNGIIMMGKIGVIPYDNDKQTQSKKR